MRVPDRRRWRGWCGWSCASPTTRAGFWLLLVIGLNSVAVVALQMYFSDAPTMTFAEYFTATQMPTSVLLPGSGSCW